MDEHWSKGFEFRFAIKKSFNGDPEPEKNSIFLLFYSLTLCVVSLLYTTTRAILRAIANAPSTCQKSKPWKIFFATGKPQSDLTLVCLSFLQTESDIVVPIGLAASPLATTFLATNVSPLLA